MKWRKDDFGVDKGTLYGSDGDASLLPDLWENRWWRRQLRLSIGRKPLVWFVDDERRNREWFGKKHAAHFAILTFSSLAYCQTALDRRTPCDLVVTDIFFPSNPVDSDPGANELMGIYERIGETKVSDLPALWDEEKEKWSLDGFDIARIMA